MAEEMDGEGETEDGRRKIETDQNGHGEGRKRPSDYELLDDLQYSKIRGS